MKSWRWADVLAWMLVAWVIAGMLWIRTVGPGKRKVVTTAEPQPAWSEPSRPGSINLPPREFKPPVLDVQALSTKTVEPPQLRIPQSLKAPRIINSDPPKAAPPEGHQ
ncbi:MAG TPA: hypothetical protein VE621_11710 [Bryobacteraceae bacterium]|nr:hypothetical protein [Bryobacteraceae bacterium]